MDLRPTTAGAYRWLLEMAGEPSSVARPTRARGPRVLVPVALAAVALGVVAVALGSGPLWLGPTGEVGRTLTGTRAAGKLPSRWTGRLGDLGVLAGAASADAGNVPPPGRLRGGATPQAKPFEEIRWRSSRAVGSPAGGRLVRGVRLPSEGSDFFTWDPVRKRSPNRGWRRYGTDFVLRRTLSALAAFAAAHPSGPRVGIGDLSRPRGGDFGRRFGSLGHASHQNGLDVDVYYPRLDRRELAPRSLRHVDRPLSQELVDRFRRAGAHRIFVGSRVGLKGPRRTLIAIPNHNDHLHVRFPKPSRSPGRTKPSRSRGRK